MTIVRSECNGAGLMPCVSVVIPCFNQGSYLPDALYSVKSAYSGPLEIIVVDDGSTDARTRRELDHLAGTDAAPIVIRKENGGLSSARNAGLARATGEFIQFLDADDLLVPSKIDRQIDHFAIVPKLDVSISDYLLCDEARISCSYVESAISTSSFELEDFLYRWERGLSIPIHCGLFRRDGLAQVRFDELLKAKEDWVFWCTLKLHGSKMAYLPLRGAVYRQHAQSMRRSYLRMGDNWLCAAAKIRSSMPGGEYPSFMDSAIAWHADCYRKNPIYINELSEVKAKEAQPGPHQAVARTAVLPRTPDPSTKLAELAARFAGLPPLHSEPLFSIVIPIFNHYAYVLECLDSVVSQNSDDFDIVCIDDASTDPRVGQMLDVLDGISPRLTILRREQNRGISANQNEAVKVARGTYLAFLDCDDTLVESALSEMAIQISSSPTVDYFFTDRIDIDVAGKTLRYASYGGYENIRYDGSNEVRADLLDGMIASHLKVIRRATYMEAGGTTEQFSGIQDWEFALRIAEIGNLQYVPKALYRHRIHDQSVSTSDSVRQFEKTNILRRQYQVRWLDPLHGESADRSEPVMLEDINLPSLHELKALWAAGRRCQILLGSKCPTSTLNFLREFNSYFETIWYENTSSWVALIGYLWGEDVLVPKEPALKPWNEKRCG
ncbi:glycosyltransferase family 2 protein [Cupriavidus necator]